MFALELPAGQFFELLVARVNLYGRRFQRSYAQQRLSIGRAEYYRRADDFSHKFNYARRDAHLDFTSICQFIHALRDGFETDSFQTGRRHE